MYNGLFSLCEPSEVAFGWHLFDTFDHSAFAYSVGFILARRFGFRRKQLAVVKIRILQHTTMVLRTRIGPDGSIISDGDGSSSSGGGGGGGGRRRLCPTSVDTFGFHLELKHFAIVLLLVSVTMGPIGSKLYDILC